MQMQRLFVGGDILLAPHGVALSPADVRGLLVQLRCGALLDVLKLNLAGFALNKWNCEPSGLRDIPSQDDIVLLGIDGRLQRIPGSRKKRHGRRRHIPYPVTEHSAAILERCISSGVRLVCVTSNMRRSNAPRKSVRSFTQKARAAGYQVIEVGNEDVTSAVLGALSTTIDQNVQINIEGSSTVADPGARVCQLRACDLYCESEMPTN